MSQTCGNRSWFWMIWGYGDCGCLNEKCLLYTQECTDSVPIWQCCLERLWGDAVLLAEVSHPGWALSLITLSVPPLLHVLFQLSALAMMPSTSCHASSSWKTLIHLEVSWNKLFFQRVGFDHGILSKQQKTNEYRDITFHIFCFLSLWYLRALTISLYAVYTFRAGFYICSLSWQCVFPHISKSSLG